MTEPGSMEPFERRFADHVRAYTDVATARRIDALRVSRTAMSSGRATGLSEGRLDAGLLDRRIADARWAAALVAVVLISIVGVAILGRLSGSGIGPQPTPATSSTPTPATSPGGPIPDVLLHSWQRPMAVTPGLDRWGSGFLGLTSGFLDFGPEPGAAASRSVVTAAGLDTLVVTATVETRGCTIGDIGAYRWSMEGKGTVMTLTAISADDCAAREEALAGQWVRSDLPLPGNGGTELPPGTYLTSAFDPFDKPGMSGQLSYTVPSGWVTFEDEPAVSFTLDHRSNASASQPSTHLVILLITQPRMAADFENGAPCGSFGDAPGVGLRVDEIVAAIQARAGVVSNAPAAVTIGGYEGQMLDLHLAPSWTGGCLAPEGAVVGVPILHGDGPGTGPLVGIGPDHPLRLILLDLAGGRTMCVAIFNIEPSQASPFEEQVAAVMPIIKSFQFHAPTP
jgi:hypothetical protein